MVELEENSGDHQNHKNSSFGEHESTQFNCSPSNPTDKHNNITHNILKPAHLIPV